MRIYLKLVLTALFWGGTFIAGRVVARHLPPFSASFLRFFLASFLLGISLHRASHRWVRPKPIQWLELLVLGFTGVFAYNAFFFSGLKYVPAGRASLIVASNPAFIALGAAFIFRERMDSLRWLGVSISVVGAVVVLTKGDPVALFRQRIAVGDLLILGCVASWVTYSLAGKKIMARLDPMTAVTYSCIIGAGLLFWPAVKEGIWKDLFRCFGPCGIGIGYLAYFGTALGFRWYYEGIEAIGAARAGVFISLVPVSAVAFGWMLLREAPDASWLVGGLMVLTGLLLTNRHGRTS